MKFEEFYFHLARIWLPKCCRLIVKDSKEFKKFLEGIVE